MGREVIEISDGETASGSDFESSRVDNPPKKTKVEPDLPEKVQWTDESDTVPTRPKKSRAKRKSAGTKKRKAGEITGEACVQDEIKLADIPDYLTERRRHFDEEIRKYHQGALMLPPDYSDIEFDESNRLGELKERPEFDARSGVKPSRPYRDIELPLSGGLIPASIAQYLRDYQVDGVRFLHEKFVYQEGGILGDDMGLGKTVQVAAFLTAAFGKTGDERDAKRMRQTRLLAGRWYPRILIICPGTLIMNWRNELMRWGWWHVDIFHGANKDDVLGTARSGLLEIMITTYDTYKNSRSSVNMVQWDAVVADECHRLKDPTSETTKAMQELNALCRIGLTGTAIQNKYEELWTLLDWTNPGHFGGRAEWNNMITKPLTVGQSHDATAAQLSLARQTARKLVQNLLPRYFLRRMKSLIAHQLPKKTDRVVFCPLTDLQREAYENFLNSTEVDILRTASDDCPYHSKKLGWCCNELLPNGSRWQSFVFPSMVVLQKLANHMTLLVPTTTDVDERHKTELRTLEMCMPDTWQLLYEKRDKISNLVNPEFCGKWKILKKLLKFWHSSGDKVLVFSHSVRLLRILQHLFTNTSYTVSYLDGSLSYEARQDIVDTFNTDPTQFVFLISTKAGGVGLNITSANKVVIIDPHWNPSYDLQAQDRAYRIGQTRDVEVFRLISLGTIEEIVYARQIYKQQQANIGYTASSERRYFRGVQQDNDRKGEIFGLSNIFTLHSDMGLLRDIVNKTNIAEAKAGVNLASFDMEQAAGDEEILGSAKKGEGEAEDGGLSQLADLLTTDNQQKLIESRKVTHPKSDAVQAILASSGVDYTHDNSEVVGSSRIEEQLSRRAEIAAVADGGLGGQMTLFANIDDDGDGLHSKFKPPPDVCLRQFCEMAREFGFVDATEFALIVEGWDVEQRRNCLNAFYKRRERKISAESSFTEQGEQEEKAEKVEEMKPVKEEIGTMTELTPKLDDPEEMKEDDKLRVKTELLPSLDPYLGEIKMESVKDEVKGKTEIDTKIKPETKVDVKVDSKGELDEKKLIFEEGKSKRTSIFLIEDDDDDDEL